MNIDKFIQRFAPLPIDQKTLLVNEQDRLPLLGYSTSKRAQPATMRRCLINAINKGVRLLDTSYSDNCEKIVGEVLRMCLKRGFVREDFFIIAKLPAIGNRKADVKKFLCKSMHNLAVRYVDIYLIESPVGFVGKDDNDVDPRDSQGNSVLDIGTDIITLWRGMERQHRKGRARFIGVCNFNVEQIGRIIVHSRLRPSFAMMDINVYNHRVPERRWLYENSINPLAILPYGNPYFITNPKCPLLLKHPKVRHISHKYKVPTKTVLIKYLVQRDVITFFQTTKKKTLINILDSYSKLNLIQRELVDLAGLELNGSAQLKDFIDCEGCTAHPEFPFLYDIRIDGVMAGPWMTCSRAEPLPSKCDWLLHNHPLPSTSGFNRNKQDDPSPSIKDTKKCNQDSSEFVPTNKLISIREEGGVMSSGTTRINKDYRSPPEGEPASSNPSETTSHLTTVNASARTTGEKTVKFKSSIRATRTETESSVDETNKKRKATTQNDAPGKKKKVVVPVRPARLKR